MEKIQNFRFEFMGYGHYKISYQSPKTGKVFKKTITDMELIDKTKNSECPKKSDLEKLKRLIKG